DVPTRTIDVLAPAGELIELLELLVGEAEPFDELGRNRLLDRAAARNASDRDPLQSRFSLEDLTRPVDAEVVRDHDARDDGLAEAPGGLDPPLVVARDRVPGEHQPRGP